MRRFLLGWIACMILPGGACAADADEFQLKAAGIPTDAAGLAAYFKQRTSTVSQESRIKELVNRLGDAEFKAREEASRQLVMLGRRVRPFLQAALKDSDPEIVRRAQDCLERITRGSTTTSLAAAVRVLARSSRAERGKEKVNAAAILLDYLPSAEEGSMAETIHQALPSLAVRDNKAEPVLIEALSDKSPVKRGAAAAALCEALAAQKPPRSDDVMARVRKLLQDPDPQVRVRLGLALAAQGDKGAVPALIRSIDDIPLEHNGLVLELLDRLAAGSPPPEMPVADQTARRKYRQAWETWWKDHQDKIESAHLERASRYLGFTLIVMLDLNTIRFLDRAQEVRWQFDSTKKPLDVQLLPGEDRVLIAEYDLNRVSVRNFKGEIVWKKQTVESEGPLTAQRLPNGNTFIATPSQLLEVDKDGKEVFTYSRPDGGQFMRATKLRNGDIACIVQSRLLPRYVRLSPSGKEFKEIKSWDVQVYTSGGRLDVLPNGHVLIPEMKMNRVIEFDADGQNVWEVTLDQPIAAVRLANGNTLVTLMRENRAVEVDQSGKEVWQFKADTRVTRAFRR